VLVVCAFGLAEEVTYDMKLHVGRKGRGGLARLLAGATTTGASLALGWAGPGLMARRREAVRTNCQYTKEILCQFHRLGIYLDL
jgi:hypothetical protein